jgi:hypothetical protein
MAEYDPTFVSLRLPPSPTRGEGSLRDCRPDVCISKRPILFRMGKTLRPHGEIAAWASGLVKDEGKALAASRRAKGASLSGPEAQAKMAAVDLRVGLAQVDND